MTIQLNALKPHDVAQRLENGAAVLVDIREADEFARRRARGALSRPLSQFESAHLKVAAGKDVVFTCKSGMRTQANCGRLASVVEGPAFILEGGLDAWSAAGLPVVEDSRAPLELMRQVQIGAGSLVILGSILGFVVHPGFYALSAAIGAGLTFAGATGHCGMAAILMRMPWNRAAAR